MGRFGNGKVILTRLAAAQLATYTLRMPDQRRLLSVFAHPRRNSFTGAVLDHAAAATESVGITTRTIDLYSEHFDPVLDADELARRFSFDRQTQEYTRALSEHTHYLFVHPDWWGGPPAILKGFLDRVLRTGIAFEWHERDDGGRDQIPLLTDRSAAVLITSDSEEPAPSLRAAWEAVCSFCGVQLHAVSVLAPVHDSRLRERRKWLDEVGSLVREWLQGGNG